MKSVEAMKLVPWETVFRNAENMEALFERPMKLAEEEEEEDTVAKETPKKKPKVAQDSSSTTDDNPFDWTPSAKPKPKKAKEPKEPKEAKEPKTPKPKEDTAKKTTASELSRRLGSGLRKP